MSKKTIAFILYGIGAVWALCLCVKESNCMTGGIFYMCAFFVAAVFGIIGTIIFFSNSGQKENINQKSSTDFLMEYKKLLDEGIIDKEEFDKKKKEILGL